MLSFIRKQTFLALFYLVARNYFKNYMLIFTNFILPLVIMLIFWAVFEKGKDDLFYIPKLLPGLASSGIFSVGLISFSSIVAGWKKSVIFKKIKASSIPKFYLPLALFLFYVIISFLSFWITIFVSMILNEKNIEQVKHISNSKNILNIIIGVIFTIFISTLIGLFIGYLSSSQTTAQTIGLSFMLINAFLLGCYITPDMLISNKTIHWFSIFFPHYSSIKLIQIGWFNGGIFKDLNQVIRETTDKSEMYEMSYSNIETLKTNVCDIKNNLKWIEFSKLNFKWEIQILMSGWTLLFVFLNFLVLKFKKNK